MRYKSTHLLWVCSITLLSLSCNKNLEDYFNPHGVSDHVYRGPLVKMGNGQVRAVFTVSPTGIPLALSIEMNDAALQGLSQDPNDFAHNTFVLSLPQMAKDLTAFNHITIDWNPKGHPPFEIYGKPHFDFHFYKISLKEQQAIPPYELDSIPFNTFPPAGYVPNTYFPSPGGVPEMGKHWLDKNAPELNGSPFTKTFIYGTYDGAVTFLEPMITYDYISSGTQSSTAYDQPKYFAPEKKYYPTRYDVARDASKHTHTISLTDFKWREMLN